MFSSLPTAGCRERALPSGSGRSLSPGSGRSLFLCPRSLLPLRKVLRGSVLRAAFRAERLLVLRRLKRRPMRVFIAALSVAAGASLAASVLIVRSSVTDSVVRVSRALAGGAALRVIGATDRGGLEQSVEDKVARVPGVRLALGLVEATTLAGPDVPSTRGSHNVLAIGIDCTNRVAMTLPDLCMAPAGSGAHEGHEGHGAQTRGGPNARGGDLPPGSAPPEDAPPGSVFVAPVLARHLARIPDPVLRTDLGTVPIAGAPVLEHLGAVDGGYAVLMRLGEAQILFDRPSRLDAIYVFPSPRTSVAALRARLESVVGPQDAVLTPSDPPPAVSLAMESYLPLLTLIALLGAAVAVALVYDVMAMSLEEGRREDAIAVALGAPPSLVATGAIVQAGVIGLLGGLGGVGLGALVARPVVASLSSLTGSLAGTPIMVHVPPGVVGLGAGLGLLVALAAAWVPSRRALHANVASELSGRPVLLEGRPRVAVGRALGFTLLAVAGLVSCRLSELHGGIAPWQFDAGVAGFVVLMLGLLLAVGSWAPVLAWYVSRLGLLKGPTSRIAVSNLARNPGRTAVMAVALSASVGVAVMTSGYDQSLKSSIAASYAPSGAGRVRVATGASGDGLGVDAKVPPAVLAKLRRLPGVKRLDEVFVLLTGNHGGDLVGVVAYSGIEVHGPVLLGRASEALFEKGEVLVGTALARRQGLRPGSFVALDAPGGIERLKVQGIWNDGSFAGEVVVMPMWELTRLYGPQPPSEVLAVPARGISPQRLAANIERAHLARDLAVATPKVRESQAIASASSQLAAFWALQHALVAVAFLAVLSTLLLVALSRRREMALLATAGMDPGRTFMLLLFEAGVVGVTGALYGVIFGLVGLVGIFSLGPLLIGYADPYALDARATFLYALLAVGVALAAGIWPAWQVARAPVLEILRDAGEE